jgi:prepilin-type N-terminal cleavage/methylation domain-containing protein
MQPALSLILRRPGLARAFTLVELIVVMAVIVVLIGITVPAFNSLNSSQGFTSAISGISTTLEQARAYAMANNTYVYVGIGEFVATESSSTTPRTAGIGQIVVATVASRDGTRGYDPTTAESSWPAYYLKGAPLQAIDKLKLYDNAHLVDLGDTPPATGNMSRTKVDPAYRITNAACVPVTSFEWPLGTDLGSGQYQFNNVIQFDPQGVVRIQEKDNSDAIAVAAEIGLQPSHGTAVSPLPSDQNTGMQAALDIDCMTGAVQIYRP